MEKSCSYHRSNKTILLLFKKGMTFRPACHSQHFAFFWTHQCFPISVLIKVFSSREIICTMRTHSNDTYRVEQKFLYYTKNWRSPLGLVRVDWFFWPVIKAYSLIILIGVKLDRIFNEYSYSSSQKNLYLLTCKLQYTR